jgi:hypothetical protein
MFLGVELSGPDIDTLENEMKAVESDAVNQR